ncbi:MAG: endonuclease/exonuclease/phosphatase family protein [Deltaproteobacteria bacterium]|nr:endonuclease/exonuclease/phosphatase family protein [Deltaproteobacteria bacterium]
MTTTFARLGSYAVVFVCLIVRLAVAADESGSLLTVCKSLGSESVSIGQIQGAGHTSPFLGEVVKTAGIVTAVDDNGFYLQDSVGDGDSSTSDGIFVFTGKATKNSRAVMAGDQFCARGAVAEYQPRHMPNQINNLTFTQIVRPTLIRLSRDNPLPAPVVIGVGGRVPPKEIIDNDRFATFDPEQDGIDFYEALEGMRVTVRDAIAVSSKPSALFVFAGATSPSGLSERGTLNISLNDFNPERIQIRRDSGLYPQRLPSVELGDSLGDVTGVMGYGSGYYRLLVTEQFTPVRARLEREVTLLNGRDGHLTIASFNVQNLAPNDADGDRDAVTGRFESVAKVIVENLRLPDIVALQEVQDNDGSYDSEVTAADQTLSLLVDRIAELGNVHYSFVDHEFIGDDTSGGQSGGNIRVAFIYNPDRVKFMPNTLTTITDADRQQDDPANPFYKARLPLVARFSLHGSGYEPVIVVNNHFTSKYGSSPMFGWVQPWIELQDAPYVNGGIEQRRLQAHTVRQFVVRQLADDRDAQIVVLGDFNDFEFSSPLKILGRALENLTERLPANERYTYIYEGNSQSLDHILVSPSLSASAEVDIVHVNAEFAETSARASDHDPVLARLRLPQRSTAP